MPGGFLPLPLMGIEDAVQTGVLGNFQPGGTYSVAANGRGTAQVGFSGEVPTPTVVLYTISSSFAEYLEIDPSEVFGLLEKQF
jgi:hypothetical protein